MGRDSPCRPRHCSIAYTLNPLSPHAGTAAGSHRASGCSCPSLSHLVNFSFVFHFFSSGVSIESLCCLCLLLGFLTYLSEIFTHSLDRVSSCHPCDSRESCSKQQREDLCSCGLHCGLVSPEPSVASISDCILDGLKFSCGNSRFFSLLQRHS